MWLTPLPFPLYPVNKYNKSVSGRSACAIQMLIYASLNFISDVINGELERTQDRAIVSATCFSKEHSRRFHSKMQLIDDLLAIISHTRNIALHLSERVCEDNRLHINILKYARIVRVLSIPSHALLFMFSLVAMWNRIGDAVMVHDLDSEDSRRSGRSSPPRGDYRRLIKYVWLLVAL